jgi:hypothetical protein
LKIEINEIGRAKGYIVKIFPMPTIGVCHVVLQKLSDGKGLVLDVFGKVKKMLN